MAKIRVHELAKELNVTNKDIMKKLEEMGVFVPSHMSALEPGEEMKVRAAFGAPVRKKEAPVRKRVIVRRTPEGEETRVVKAARPSSGAPAGAGGARTRVTAPRPTAPGADALHEQSAEGHKPQAADGSAAQGAEERRPQTAAVPPAQSADNSLARTADNSLAQNAESRPSKSADASSAQAAEVRKPQAADVPPAQAAETPGPQTAAVRPQQELSIGPQKPSSGAVRPADEKEADRSGQPDAQKAKDGLQKAKDDLNAKKQTAVRRPLEGEIIRRADGKLVRRIPIPKGETAQSMMAKREAERLRSGKDAEITVVQEFKKNSSDGTSARSDRDRGRTARLTKGPQGQRRDGQPTGTARDGRRQDGRPNEGRRNGAAFRGQDMDQREAPRENGRDLSRRGARRQDSSQLLGDLIIPERPKIEDKPKKNERSRKEKSRSASAAAEDFSRRKNNARIAMSMMDDDLLARPRKKPKPNKNLQDRKQETEEDSIRVVTLPDSMTVKEFAEFIGKPSAQIIKALMLKGVMAGLNQQIEFDQAEEIAVDMGILVEHEVEEDIFAAYTQENKDKEEDLVSRSPVVVVMGHVDHGKTSLLDKIRSTKVTAGEAGGITQSIGASVVEVNGRKITFLDTPGHEAFTAMRMRGAQVTDIAILVVAADDGVMPQTVEAINHAKTAGVQIIVAINKIDKPGANPDRVMQELMEYDLVPEAWGGSTICVPVSALTGEGVNTLLEMVLLVADIEDYKANPNCAASGSVIEAELDKGRGAVATVLVQRGTLKLGDPVVVGHTFGRIKAMQDDSGQRVKTAGPSTPVEIVGLSDVPEAGEKFYVTESDHEARTLAEKVSARERQSMVEGNKRVSLNDLFDQIQEGEMKELNIVVKADTQGSVEAVRQSLEKLSNSEVAVRCIHGGVGAITESDVMLASTANALIVGFNVRPDAGAKSVADQEKIDIRLYRVIYTAIEEIEAAMKGMLAPKFEEKVVGHAEVRQVFHASGVGTIAGSYVLDGKVQRSNQIRLVRDGIVIYEGEIASLRRFKDDVREVAAGYECGIMLNRFADIKEGDTLETFLMEEIEQ